MAGQLAGAFVTVVALVPEVQVPVEQPWSQGWSGDAFYATAVLGPGVLASTEQW